MTLIFVDCEAYGGCPATGQLTEFGAVAYPSLATFHGRICPTHPDPDNPAVPVRNADVDELTIRNNEAQEFERFAQWLRKFGGVTFVSDNVAFDWQWINDGFHRTVGYNPFGHSGRRISDYYAGLTNEWRNTQKWKRLRITAHTHNPVDDAMGNAEAFRRLEEGER